jgi:HlyD family secretion protein
VFPMPEDGHAASADSAVFVSDQGRARLRPVEVAARNGSAAWIRKGLSAGEKVIVYPPAAVTDGARVVERRV